VQPVERPVQKPAVLEVASSSSLGTAGLDLQVIAALAFSGCQRRLRSSVADPDPYAFGPPRYASRSVSHEYGSGSFHHQAKIVRKP
jgi:hypothetical protein